MTCTPRHNAPGGPRTRRAFTLLETAMTLVIIAVGVLAIIESQQYFFKANTWSSHAATGTFLANEVREMTRRYSKHDPVTGLSMINIGGADELVGWGFEAGEITVADFDDIDDFDGMSFRFDGTAASQNEDGVFIIDDNDLPGPIDAFGLVIENLDGADLDGEPSWGWSQFVTVEKVDPFDYTIVYDPDFSLPPAGTFPGLRVDQFPLRVTVTVEYQGPLDAEPAEVSRVSWIVP